MSGVQKRIATTVTALWFLICRESNDHRYGGRPPLPTWLSTVAGGDPWLVANLVLALCDGDIPLAAQAAKEMDNFQAGGSVHLAVARVPPMVDLDVSVHGTSSTLNTFRQVLVFSELCKHLGGLGALSALFSPVEEALPWALPMDGDDAASSAAMIAKGFPPAIYYHAVRPRSAL